jgi:hypothetical protein
LQDGEAEQDQFADWLGDASDDDGGGADGGAEAPSGKNRNGDEHPSGGAPLVAFNVQEDGQAEEPAGQAGPEDERAAVGTVAERRPLFG